MGLAQGRLRRPHGAAQCLAPWDGQRRPAVASGGQGRSGVVSSGQRGLAVPRGCGTFEYEASLTCLSKALRVCGAIAER